MELRELILMSVGTLKISNFRTPEIMALLTSKILAHRHRLPRAGLFQFPTLGHGSYLSRSADATACGHSVIVGCIVRRS
jgi:hypothetical protein